MTTESSNSLVSLHELDGIDAEAGLKTVANNENLFRRLLGKFTDNQQGFEQEFNTHLQNHDMEAAASTAHTLKGVAANLGMTALQQSALALEAACNEGSGDVNSLFFDTVKNLEIVLNSLKKL